MGQYVKRSGKTYYKGDDGKLYKDYAAAAQANYPTIADRLLGVQVTKPLANILDASSVINAVGSGLQNFGRSARAALDPNYAADEYARQWAEQSIPKKEKPVVIPAGTVDAGAIVQGLTPAGTVDRSQSDEYKSQMAQYQNLINQKKQAEAEDLGMKIWMEKYAKTPMAQAGGAIGAYNPLLAATFPETKGFAGTFATPEEVQMGDLGTRAQGELGPTMESLNPLASQAAQQEATATQADMATTAGMSTGDRARNLTRAFRLGLI